MVRFYAGVPLAIPGKDKLKHRIGTLCLIDSRPRDLDPKSIALLQDLGHLVENEIELSMTAKKANARLKTEAQDGENIRYSITDGRKRTHDPRRERKLLRGDVAKDREKT